MTRRWPIHISRRFLKVWRRDLIVYRKIWKINLLTPVFEPLLYLLAFGVGLGSLVGKISYQQHEVSYIAFITPALLAVNIMYNAFFENTYASFVRMYYQKTFDAMLATPLSLNEVITGEILWGATKAVIATVIMQIVISVFGLIHYPQGLLILPLAFLGGLAFGAMGMLCTGFTPTIDVFNLPIFLLITPMFLFGGTFFPTDHLPSWAQKVALLFPLTHLVEALRQVCFGLIQPGIGWHLAVLIGAFLVFFPLSLVVMHRRLIR
ncbi:MAG TPA: ABC transporter permease [Syntrophobacteraceae bacterium]|nr:ABC transporter permease [Syntrophobacteraceae bacterium]HBD09030.1 ABC transporter permease [Syntrophobacteraceae bacterium]HBZ54328.1 ABC transporter permease [Syntrophobacteraceae bacterium]